MRKPTYYIIANLLLLFTAQLYAQDEIKFKLRRDVLFPNSYYLDIENNGSRTLTFSAYSPDLYTLEFKNGETAPLNQKAFWEHYIKGVIWISQGEKNYLPLKITRDQFRNAKRLVIKGQSQIEKRIGNTVENFDNRHLTVTFDFETNITSYEVGDPIVIDTKAIEDSMNIKKDLPGEHSTGEFERLTVPKSDF